MYVTIIDVFASVGGLIQFITVFIVASYNSYNSYKMFKYIILKVIIGKESIYPERYRLRKDYYHLVKHKNYGGCFRCCMKSLDSEEQEKLSILKSCRQVLTDRLDLANY